MSSSRELFFKFHAYASQVLDKHLNPAALRERGGSFKVVPPSVRQLAEQCEHSEAFVSFVSAALPSKGGPQVWAVSEIVRRCGFYHDLLAGRDPDNMWERIAKRLVPRTVQMRTLHLLDGCAFPINKFPVFDHSIERFSKEEIASFGPPLPICESFYPTESIDAKWFSRQWFLRSDRRHEKKPTTITVWLNPDVIRDVWKPLLSLTLYDISSFGVPIMMESEEDWKLERVIWNAPAFEILSDEHGTEVPRSDYRISAEELPRFQEFLRFTESAIEAFENNTLVRVAARRYLRAMLISGPEPSWVSDDEAEDVLLQYVFAMEQVLLAEGEKEAIADKIATRCAYMIGLDDDAKRKKVFSAVKTVYEQRSRVVHGARSNKKGKSNKKTRALELQEIRDLVRRLLVAIVSLRLHLGSDPEWYEALRELPVSRKIQDTVIDSSRQAFSLMKEAPSP